MPTPSPHSFRSPDRTTESVSSTKTTTTAANVFLSADQQPARLTPVGETAWLLQSVSAETSSPNSQDILHDQTAFWALKDAFDRIALNGIEETVLGNRNLTIIFNPFDVASGQVARTLISLWQNNRREPLRSPQKCLTIPIYFGGDQGPDLCSLAHRLDMSCERFVRVYCEPVYTVLFLGFQPGFAYLHGMPEALAAPRLGQPRHQVPAGSLAIGGHQTGIYPGCSPGGWHIIGRISDSMMPLFNPHQRPPCRLNVKEQFRFIPQTHTLGC